MKKKKKTNVAGSDVFLEIQIYRICHGLTVEINFIKRVLKNVIKPAFGELNNIFQDQFNKNLSLQLTNNRYSLSHN